MNVQFASNCPSDTSILLLSSIIALKLRNSESPDIASLSAILLTANYCVAANIAAITTLLTNAENVTIEQTSARIDVTGSTTVTTLAVNSSGLLYIVV